MEELSLRLAFLLLLCEVDYLITWSMRIFRFVNFIFGSGSTPLILTSSQLLLFVWLPLSLFVDALLFVVLLLWWLLLAAIEWCRRFNFRRADFCKLIVGFFWEPGGDPESKWSWRDERGKFLTHSRRFSCVAWVSDAIFFTNLKEKKKRIDLQLIYILIKIIKKL